MEVFGEALDKHIEVRLMLTLLQLHPVVPELERQPLLLRWEARGMEFSGRSFGSSSISRFVSSCFIVFPCVSEAFTPAEGGRNAPETQGNRMKREEAGLELAKTRTNVR